MGGMALEIRLGDRARSTRDLDLALRDAGQDGSVVRELLIECLAADPDDDGFDFRVGPPRVISADEAGRLGWRFAVEARLGGTTYASVRLDVVSRADEIAMTRRVALPGILGFAGLPRHDVEIVDPEQHFAEKIHALTRSYGDRENSRVRDLSDLVLLIEDGVTATPRLLAIVAHVFDERASHGLPNELPDPPSAWRESYPATARGMDVSAATLDEPMTLVRAFWTSIMIMNLES